MSLKVCFYHATFQIMLRVSVLVVMDDDQELEEPTSTQSEESGSREETRDGEHQPLRYVYQLLYIDLVLPK